MDENKIAGHIHVVTKLQSGDIRVTADSANTCDHLLNNLDYWLPSLSSKLKSHKDYCAVIVHGMPTSFNTDFDGDDVMQLLWKNESCLPHPESIHEVQWIGHTSTNGF
jgi:hypothetical protein